MIKIASALLISLLAATACASDADPTASAVTSPAPTATVTPSPTATSTSTVTPTQKATRPTPSASPFIDNEDCASITRQLLPIVEVTVSDSTRSVSVQAELAQTNFEQSQGLMCRSVVPPGSGMLFTFDQPRGGGFWMFNTYVPLDIIYASEDGSVDIVQMNPCPRNSDEEFDVWRSRCATEADDYEAAIQHIAALELPQGWLDSIGFDTDNPSDVSISFENTTEN